MNAKNAARLAKDALAVVRVGDPVDVADATVLFRNADGTWSVCDNGEEVICSTQAQVIRIIRENLAEF